ncbi:MAG: hypothetical protein HY895_14405 [Deltaproteobacteria bacterium]|nr:hypothetical protein [Deltaproteobacteria bacterium]
MDEKQTGRHVFQRLRCSGADDLKLSGTAVNILLEVDGKTNLDKIAVRTGMPLAKVQAAVTTLMEQGLIEQIQTAEPMVPVDTFSKIQAFIVKAIGPVGEYLLEEKTEDMGHSIAKFPLHLLPELVENIAQEIRRPDISLSFKRQMIELIQTLNRQ